MGRATWSCRTPASSSLHLRPRLARHSPRSPPDRGLAPYLLVDPGTENIMAKISFLNPRREAQPEPGALNPSSSGDGVPMPDDGRRAARIGLWALAIGFAGFLLWAAFAPLDEGVAAPGLVSIDTKRKAVQHLTGGIVKDVNVREGQSVKEGQVLIKLDEGTARANFEASRQRYMSLRAMQGRLMAEQAGQTKITWHPDL